MREHWAGALTQFIVLLVLWLALSDQRGPLFLVLGALSAGLVTALTNEVVRTVLHHPMGSLADKANRARCFLVFVFWMLGRIFVASVQMAYFALHLGLPFQPRFVQFRTTMRRPLSRVVLAVSITLVPGTITVRLEGDTYLVHTLIPPSADDLAAARMQNMVGRFLGEAPEEPPEMVWGPLIEEAIR
jgi:multicomponent Na+:H+ antiporter subunit E